MAVEECGLNYESVPTIRKEAGEAWHWTESCAAKGM